MIRHVVMIKFKPEAEISEREKVVAGLRALPQTIDVIREFEVGVDVLHLSRSYDVAIVSSFADLGALDTYQRHPAHVEVALHIRELSDAVASVDYEV